MNPFNKIRLLIVFGASTRDLHRLYLYGPKAYVLKFYQSAIDFIEKIVHGNLKRRTW